jgi:hypothetical protein
MPDCYRCGASTEWAEKADGGRVLLDTYESYGGPGRWVVNQDGIAEPVDRFADVAAQTEHRLTCASGAEPGARQ